MAFRDPLFSRRGLLRAAGSAALLAGTGMAMLPRLASGIIYDELTYTPEKTDSLLGAYFDSLQPCNNLTADTYEQITTKVNRLVAAKDSIVRKFMETVRGMLKYATRVALTTALKMSQGLYEAVRAGITMLTDGRTVLMPMFTAAGAFVIDDLTQRAVSCLIGSLNGSAEIRDAITPIYGGQHDNHRMGDVRVPGLRFQTARGTFFRSHRAYNGRHILSVRTPLLFSGRQKFFFVNNLA